MLCGIIWRALVDRGQMTMTPNNRILADAGQTTDGKRALWRRDAEMRDAQNAHQTAWLDWRLPGEARTLCRRLPDSMARLRLEA